MKNIGYQSNNQAPAIPPRPPCNPMDSSKESLERPALPPKARQSSASFSDSSNDNRRNVVIELIQNEETFCDQIRDLSIQMSKMREGQNISDKDIADIWLNLDDYMMASMNIVRAYETAITEVPNRDHGRACVAKHLLPQIPKFKIEMVKYITNYNPKILKEKPYLTHFFEKIEEKLADVDGAKATISDRLLQAFQRPFTMFLILERLQKNTPKNHSDYVNVGKVITAITAACKEADINRKKDIDYCSQSDFCATQTSNCYVEDCRMAYFRKSMTKLSNFIENIIEWIETKTEIVKLFVSKRRMLIQSIKSVCDQFDGVTQANVAQRFTGSSFEYREFDRNDLTTKKVDLITQLRSVNDILKENRKPLKKLKRKASTVTKHVKSKNATHEEIKDYQLQERMALKKTELMFENSHLIVKAGLLFFMHQVFEFLHCITINQKGPNMIHTQPIVPLTESSMIDEQIKQDIDLWKGRTSAFHPSNSQGGAAAPAKTKTSPGMLHHGSNLRQGRRSMIWFGYQDDQTTEILEPGQYVEVLKESDFSGCTEWFQIRTASGKVFFYPANYLQCVD